jgi:sirohydrochlorin cobaltochelatase
MSRALVFVGHGGVPSDFPTEELSELKRLEGARRGGALASARESELDVKLRGWPRSPETDPYRVGFERLAEALRQQTALPVYVAYNEFCAPSVEEAVAQAVQDGHDDLTLLTSMITPGGNHAAREIPELAERCRQRLEGVRIRYAWPFEPGLVAAFLAQHLLDFDDDTDGEADTVFVR